jgi:hypothetical protein
VFARVPAPVPVDAVMVGGLMISLRLSADQASCTLDSAAAALQLTTWERPKESSRVVGL